jgi:hypothetical protein
LPEQAGRVPRAPVGRLVACRQLTRSAAGCPRPRPSRVCADNPVLGSASMLLRLAPAAALLSLLSVVQAGTFDRPVINLTAKTFDKEVLKDDVRRLPSTQSSPQPDDLADDELLLPAYSRKCQWLSSTPRGEFEWLKGAEARSPSSGADPPPGPFRVARSLPRSGADTARTSGPSSRRRQARLRQSCPSTRSIATRCDGDREVDSSRWPRLIAAPPPAPPSGQASNRNLCAKYEVKGFPTIKAFTRGGRIPPRDYTGERQAGPLTTYASHAVADRVKKLKFPAKGGVEPAAARQQMEAFLSQVRRRHRFSQAYWVEQALTWPSSPLC